MREAHVSFCWPPLYDWQSIEPSPRKWGRLSLGALALVLIVIVGVAAVLASSGSDDEACARTPMRTRTRTHARAHAHRQLKETHRLPCWLLQWQHCPRCRPVGLCLMTCLLAHAPSHGSYGRAGAGQRLAIALDGGIEEASFGPSHIEQLRKGIAGLLKVGRHSPSHAKRPGAPPPSLPSLPTAAVAAACLPDVACYVGVSVQSCKRTHLGHHTS